jgi:hypothetical protein
MLLVGAEINSQIEAAAAQNQLSERVLGAHRSFKKAIDDCRDSGFGCSAWTAAFGC